MENTELNTAFQKIINVIHVLRGPEGCNWDKQQTAESLKSSLLEETYECIDAINENDRDNLREELGDIILLVSMISRIKEEEQQFSLADVLTEIAEKLIRRHPHVFGDSGVKSVKGIKKQWEHIKENVEKKYENKLLLDTVPLALPPLLRAWKLQKKAAKVGFDWPDRKSVLDKLHEEIDELKEAADNKDREEMEKEFGDLFFSIVNLSRFFKIDPAIALSRTNEKFYKRFCMIENELKKQNRELRDTELAEMDRLWELTKDKTR